MVEHTLTELDALIAHSQEVRSVLVALGRCQCLTLEECAALAARCPRVEASLTSGENRGQGSLTPIVVTSN